MGGGTVHWQGPRSNLNAVAKPRFVQVVGLMSVNRMGQERKTCWQWKRDGDDRRAVDCVIAAAACNTPGSETVS
jgi:hypothetical protein